MVRELGLSTGSEYTVSQYFERCGFLGTHRTLIRVATLCSQLWSSAQGLPKSAFSMRGAGGQSTTIIPTHGLVVVRLGKYTGAEFGRPALEEAFRLLMEAVPPLEDPVARADDL